MLATAPEMFAHLAGRPGWRVVRLPAAAGRHPAQGLVHPGARAGAGPRACGGDLLHSLQFVAPLRPGCPTVVTVHDLAWELFPGTVEQPRRGYYRLFVGPSLRRAAAVVTNSEATAADVRRLHPEAADRVSRHPLRPGSLGPGGGRAHGAARRRPGRSGRPRFLFVGTLEPRKNLEGVLRAYERFLAAADRPGRSLPVPALRGGRGWRDSKLRAAMQDLQEAGHLEVRDYCDPEELWGLYRSAHGLLFPSLHEGFGFPILEAMAAGLPVLTANRGAMAEVAGDAALLVDPTVARKRWPPAWRVWPGTVRCAPGWRPPVRPARRAWTWERTAAATCARLHPGAGPLRPK